MKNFVVQIPKIYDIVLATGIDTTHRISGHSYELIDYYYYFLNNKCKTCILLSDETVMKCFTKILDKYRCFEDEKPKVFFVKNTKIIQANNVLWVDGGNDYRHNVIVDGNQYAFRCLDKTNLNDKKTIFQDSRIYEDLPNSIHYVKKINFDYYKKIKKSKHRTLLYLTSNCRMISEQEMLRIRKKYPGMRFLIISDVDKPYFHFDNAEFRYVPVDNLFEEFDTYMYTEVKDACHGDCSPRFIAECKFYEKEVIYENLTSSPGLEIRKYDIEHNFEKLFLTKNDPLADYIFK